MEELDKKDWDIFQANPSDKLSVEEVKLIAQLHAKYFKHQFTYLWCSKTFTQPRFVGLRVYHVWRDCDV